mgnify:CR=1 FL=1
MANQKIIKQKEKEVNELADKLKKAKKSYFLKKS